MPDTVLYCPKCQDYQRFEVNAYGEVLCLGCYDVRKLSARDRLQAQARVWNRGKRERA